MLRSLIITNEGFPRSNEDAAGGLVRLRRFIGAIASLGSDIEILHFVPAKFLANAPSQGTLDRTGSDYWGHRVKVLLVPLSRRPKTHFNHYISPLFSALEHHYFYDFSTDLQAQGVRSALAQRTDLVFVHRLAAMCPLLLSQERPPRVFFDLDDVEHKARLRAALSPPIWPGKLAYAAQTIAIHAKERQAARLAAATFVCSELDRRYLARLGVRNVRVVPNAVTLPDQVVPAVAERTLLFIGNFNHTPNIGAAERLVRDIWPLVQARVPSARLLIAGRPPELLPSFGAAPQGVDYLGFVEDLTALYARSRVVCCPMIVGGGTRVKLIEAGAHAKPMVSTRIGAEGLDFVPEREILIRESDSDVAAACIHLLEDDAACKSIGMAARARAEQAYAAPIVERRIAELLTERLSADVVRCAAGSRH